MQSINLNLIHNRELNVINREEVKKYAADAIAKMEAQFPIIARLVVNETHRLLMSGYIEEAVYTALLQYNEDFAKSVAKLGEELNG